MERERDIERWLERQVRNMGGEFLKFTSPGNSGVPDRIAILPGREVWFIELKTPSGRLAAIQEWQIDRLQALGCRAIVIRGKAEAAAWLEERKKEGVVPNGVHTAQLPKAGN